MKLTALQFGVCASVAGHGLLFGTFAIVGLGLQKAERPDGNSIVTLTLIAAPDEPAAEGIGQTAGTVASGTARAKLPSLEAPRAPAHSTTPATTEKPPKSEPMPERTPLGPPDDSTGEGSVGTEAEMERGFIRSAATAASLDRTPQVRLGEGGGFHQPGSDAAIFRASSGVRAEPGYRKNPQPRSPLAARRQRQEGLVVLTVNVTAQGRAGLVEIRQSSGFTVLDNAALQAVRLWEFEPARIDSLAVTSVVEVPVHFKLAN